MKQVRQPLPDFTTSYTHSCNNLASYEVKKNKNPHKDQNVTTKGADLVHKEGSSLAKSKASFQQKKDHSTSINELRTFSKPNLDDGNRFFDDNRKLLELFSGSVTQNMAKYQHQGDKQNNFSGYSKHFKQQPKFIPVTYEPPKCTRSYQTMGYTPKTFSGRPQTAIQSKYKVYKAYSKEKPLAEATVWQHNPKVDYGIVAQQASEDRRIQELQRQNYELSIAAQLQ